MKIEILQPQVTFDMYKHQQWRCCEQSTPHPGSQGTLSSSGGHWEHVCRHRLLMKISGKRVQYRYKDPVTTVR